MEASKPGEPFLWDECVLAGGRGKYDDITGFMQKPTEHENGRESNCGQKALGTNTMKSL